MKKILFLFCLLGIAGCQQAPYTHRNQLILVSASQEATLGVQAYKDTLKKSQLVSSGPDLELIHKVGSRIAPVADQDLREQKLAPFQWEFNLIEDSKTVNAWCLPGGKVAFYTGILPICKGEWGIATVMGHEIGHAIAHHGAERMSTQMGFQLIGTLLEVGFSGSKKETQDLVLGAYGAGSGLASLTFSRKEESEADYIGLMLMAKAGYDPREAVQFWKRMAALSKDSPPEFLSTHPSDATRMADLEKLLPQAIQLYENSKTVKP